MLLTLPFQKISVALQLLSNAQPSFPNTRLCTFRKFAVPRRELAQLVRVESAGLILGHRFLLACLRRLKGDLKNEARAMIVLISANAPIGTICARAFPKPCVMQALDFEARQCIAISYSR